MTRRPAVFFDRDNTLIVNDGYLGDPTRVQLMPGAPQAVSRARAMGFATVVISNQSGVGRGMFTEDDVRAVNAKMDRMLLDVDTEALVERHEFCCDHPKAKLAQYAKESERRKPNPGMILDAAEKMKLDLKKSWLIGDAPRDIEAGHKAGCRTILLKDPILSQMESEATNEPTAVEPDYVATSLTDAVDFIEMHSMEKTTTASAKAPISVEAAELTPSAAPAIDGEATAIAHAVVAAAVATTPSPSMSTPLTSSMPTPRLDAQSVLLERILDELRRANDPPQDFSIAKMLAGVVQGLAIAAMFAALIAKDNFQAFQMLMLLAIFLEAAVSALLLMGR